MEPNEPTRKPFRFADPRQERIYKRLLLIGPGPASFYRDACRLMADESPPDSTTHLVSHLLREIESALRDVLEPLTDRLMHRTDQEESRDAHKTEIRAVLKALEIPEADPVAEAWLRMAGKKNEYGLYSRAHRDALAQPRPVDQDFRTFWGEMEAILDALLDKFESRYLASHRLLDELLTKTSPTRSDAQTLRNRAPNSLAATGYFFDSLSNPAWLEPLRDEGFFRHPPKPDRDADRGTIGFPRWPQSRYLERMAGLAPEVVLEIALEIPGTENVRVHEDLADAAVAMPPHLAATLVAKAKTWLESRYHLLLPEKLGKLLGHLARGGEVNAALDLAESLFAVLPPPERVGKALDDDRHLLAEPRALFETYLYEQILKEDFPDLVDAADEPALVLLCDALDSTIGTSDRRGEHEQQSDHSYIWRPAIEEHGQNEGSDLRHVLVSAVRDAAERIARRNPAEVLRLVEMLENRQTSRHIFQRIALHLLRNFPKAAPDLIAQRLTDRARFDELCLWHEYWLLARECFGCLMPEDQMKVLGWIEAGPDPDDVKALEQDWLQDRGQKPTLEQVQKYANGWRLKRLAIIREVLPPEWKERYEALVAELGEPDHPEFTSYSQTWVGPTSPKGAEELRSMSVEEIVQFFRAWKPSSGFMSPSPEGLARVLAEVVASDATQFGSQAGQFQGLDPTYVRGLLSGLREATAHGRAFPWPPVLSLCQWILDQPREIDERRTEYTDLDPGWGWTRKAIADLLSTGFRDGAAEIPFDLRTSAWTVLRPLTDDPDPTQDHQARYGGSNMDPAALSVNTTCGESMHAVVQYALWVRRHIQEEPDGMQRAAPGFDEMPEVREVLDAHLELTRDRSLAIRSVYGRWLPWLILLDSGWVRSSLPKIFPSGEELQDLYDAAWETYIIFSKPYHDAFEVLIGEYGRAVGRIGAPPSERRRVANPEERLAEHLMELYCHGKLDLDDPEGVLGRFYAKAPDALRGHAIEFVGRRLRNTEGAVAIQVLDRLGALWTRRICAARSAKPLASHKAEVTAFGWWFASAKFDDAWAIGQLNEALKLTGWVEPDHLVVERLAALTATMPHSAVECLSVIIEGDKETWGIRGWGGHARTILATALQSSEEPARTAAAALVNRLGARGYLEFRDLLSDRRS